LFFVTLIFLPPTPQGGHKNRVNEMLTILTTNSFVFLCVILRAPLWLMDFVFSILTLT